ncbi:MAG: penicillin-binding transpeptidase domain-containing protein [Desulfobacterales bacterium]
MTRMLSRPLKIADPYRRDNKWRTYQSSLKKRQTLRRSFRRIPFYALAAAFLILLTHALFALLDRTLAVPEADYAHVLTEQFETFDKNSLQTIFNRIPFDTSAENRFELTTAGTTYGIRSSLNPGLQEFILGQIDRKNSLYFGFVAMDPVTGRILSMVSFDKTGNDANVCIQPEYPAASLFKIITAAAAIEKCGFDCTTPVTFNDNKYTLYKIQLKDRINKYTNRMTFAESFADSVNPVFGKLGKNRLGKSALESYARAFGFNQPFDLEIPLKASVISITDTPYHWAEIASGFNRETQISPLHGAMMIAGIR